MSKSSEDAILEYIRLPENYDIAHKVSENFKRLEYQLQSEFWNVLKRNLEESIALSPKEFKEWDSNLQGVHSSIGLIPKKASPEKLYCYPCLEQTGGWVYYGVIWNKAVAKEPSIPEYVGLKRMMREEFKLAGTASGWWVGRGPMNVCLTGPETLRELALGNGLLQARLADELFEVFKHTRHLVENLNAALMNT